MHFVILIKTIFYDIVDFYVYIKNSQESRVQQ